MIIQLRPHEIEALRLVKLYADLDAGVANERDAMLLGASKSRALDGSIKDHVRKGYHQNHKRKTYPSHA